MTTTVLGQETPTLESKLEVIAMSYDHWRVCRDNASRAQDYLARLHKRGGKKLLEMFWADLEYVDEGGKKLTIGLDDLLSATTQLSAHCTDMLNKTKAAMIRMKETHKLKGTVENILQEIVEQKLNQNKRKKSPVNATKTVIYNGNNSEIIDALQDLPHLANDEAYEYMGDTMINGQKVTKWKVVKAAIPTETMLPNVLSKPFSLKRRPKESK